MSGGGTSTEPFTDLAFRRVTGRRRPAAPRIPPLREEELDDEQREMLDRSGLGRPNMFTTFIRDKRIFRRWNSFGGAVLRGRLPGRERELAILRATWIAGCDYLWESHVRAGLKVGLSLEEAERVADGPDAPGWSELEAALVRVADELHGDGCVSDETWQVLAARYDQRELIELVMVVGCYFLNSWVTNSLGVAMDDQVTGHPPERSPEQIRE